MTHIQSKDGAGGSFEFGSPITGGDFDRLVRSVITDFDLSADESRRRVTLTLKDEITPIAAIARLQLAITALHDTHAISPATLKRWSSDRRFHDAYPPNGRISLEVLPDSRSMSRQHQDQIGLNDLRIVELVLGDLGYFFLTGKHLLTNGSCRAADGTLHTRGGTLRDDTTDDGSAREDIYASHRLPCI